MKVLLYVRKETPQMMLLSLAWGFRMVFAVIAGFMLTTMIVSAAIGVFPMILLILSITALWYQEQWIFDKEKNRVSHVLTLFSFVLRIHTFPLDAVEAMFVEKPSHRQRMLRTGFCMKDGTTRLLELRPPRNSSDLIVRVADFLQVSIET